MDSTAILSGEPDFGEEQAEERHDERVALIGVSLPLVVVRTMPLIASM